MKKLTIIHVALVIFVSIVLVTWFKSDKLASYWQQEQGTSEPFESMSNSSIGKIGNAVDSFNSEKEINAELKRLNEEINKIANRLLASDNLKDSEIEEIKQTQKRIEAKINALMKKRQQKGTFSSANSSNRVNIATDKKALFIGDSLMQGVAPWVMRKLQNDYKIKSINLSKHSTGLTVSKFFDWPATLEKALQDNPDVSVLFVFLGGNDGQSIIDPKTKHYVKFGTERWDEVYTGRIHRVLDTARANEVQVLWIAPPEMKKASLNKRTAHLIELYKKIPSDRAIVLASKEILQSDTAKVGYSDSMLVKGKLKKVRTADGVHFTPTGQKLIANAIMEKMDIDGQSMLSTTKAY